MITVISRLIFRYYRLHFLFVPDVLVSPSILEIFPVNLVLDCRSEEPQNLVPRAICSVERKAKVKPDQQHLYSGLRTLIVLDTAVSTPTVQVIYRYLVLRIPYIAYYIGDFT